MFIFYLYTPVIFEFYLVYISVIRKKIKKEKHIQVLTKMLVF